MRLPWKPGVKRELTRSEVIDVCERWSLDANEVAYIELLDDRLTVRMVGKIEKININMTVGA